MAAVLDLRPTLLETRPPSTKRVHHPLDRAKHAVLLARYRDVAPEQR